MSDIEALADLVRDRVVFDERQPLTPPRVADALRKTHPSNDAIVMAVFDLILTQDFEAAQVRVSRFYNIRRADEYTVSREVAEEIQTLVGKGDLDAADALLGQKGSVVEYDRRVDIDPENEMLNIYIDEEED